MIVHFHLTAFEVPLSQYRSGVRWLEGEFRLRRGLPLFRKPHSDREDVRGGKEEQNVNVRPQTQMSLWTSLAISLKGRELGLSVFPLHGKPVSSR